MNFFKTSVILSFALSISAPAFSMQSAASYKNVLVEACKENPVTAATIGLSGAATLGIGAYLYKTGKLGQAARASRNALNMRNFSSIARGTATGFGLGVFLRPSSHLASTVFVGMPGFAWERLDPVNTNRSLFIASVYIGYPFGRDIMTRLDRII